MSGTHSMQRALARLEATDGDHVRAKSLEVPAVTRAMGQMLETLLGQALNVRDAPPVLRTFARTSKHMIPAMLEGMASVPEQEVVDILRYVSTEIAQVLAAHDEGQPLPAITVPSDVAG